jgi:hypothetical protein
MHFDAAKKNWSPKIEKFHCYVHRFAVSKVDQWILTRESFRQILGVESEILLESEITPTLQ